MFARLFFAAMFCSLLVGQEHGVPVVIDGEEVLRVYGSVGQFSASDRAPEIKRRIVALAEKGYAGEIVTRDVPSEKATAVAAGPFLIANVFDADAQAAGVSRQELARKWADAVQKAITDYRVRHSWPNFLMAIGKTLVAWTLFCLVAWSLWKAIQWFSLRLEHWVRRLTPAQDARGFHLMLWDRGRRLVVMAVRITAGISLLFVFSFLISYTFGLFPLTAGISTTLWDYLRLVFGGISMAIINYLPDGGVVLIVVWLTYHVLRFLKFLARGVENGDLKVKSLHPEMAAPTYQLVRFLVILAVLVVVSPYLPGGKSDAFKGVSIFLGLLLSLGSSSAVSNVLAGLVLTYMRPFRVGDRVKIADNIGDVLEKNLLVTRLRTIKNVEVVIPNGPILSNQILNYSALARTRGLILNTTVTIGYDAPWRTVHELLIQAALNTEGVLPEPRPFVLETSLNDFHISYELNAYTDRPNEIQDIYSRLHQSIQDSFNKAGVEIMSPTFYALRDGNTVTIPANDRPAGYEAPAFRVKTWTQPR